MTQEPTDRRVRRTRDLLRKALIALIQEKGWDRITVQDILDRADIGRSTFYAHYRDKEDLLVSGFEDIRAALAAEVEAGDTRAGGQGELLRPLLVVFEHVDAYRESWTALTRKGGVEVIVRILRQSVTDLVQAHFRARFAGTARDPVQAQGAACFVVGACMDMLRWWLDNDVPYTAEEIHGLFQQLAATGVEAFMAT